ncbi:D-alanyl-D-alanine carboxypeptidase/D-alanyl-D-alanine endopeptidase [Rhodococcus chondri]|uniref:D-alanyl-D-alanine carboxypeptidase/D-alanyl-D-alanine-endopeptidase n=1 Tax=Rhodococcus chondri TaxID=3065941 RepID=A0ABU7JY90_9NOCA|nr:D-alanyl-D-alanine carboxypeptidase/D-alanyl-D-alanine-endopeptidase [Rhodococcus sp. CC-R104]MEE2034982.1 D-alanyl-D-alanine carboxypeptidase/D-alanyl-D-alanine-endopeptidase [Rhodococcus sp. CC-R104]
MPPSTPFGAVARIGIALTATVLAVTACASVDTTSAVEDSPETTTGASGDIPDAAAQIMAAPEYRTARWLFHIVDPENGAVLLSQRPDEMVFTGSTAKEFTLGTVYDTIGPDTTLTTPVYATQAPVNGAVSGDLVLVASGDLALGGRGATDGRVDETFTADTIDHVYGDLALNATTVPDDPLAGLDALARQVTDAGITRVDGDVVIDTRIWDTYQGQEGPVPSVFVNDNILDITVTADGDTVTAETRPRTQAYAVESTVTVGDEASLTVDVDPANPRRLTVSGTITADSSQLTIYRVPDAAEWARTLFTEALDRAGVTVAAPAVGPNNEAGLPAPDSYPDNSRVASLESPPLKTFGSMILQTSYNTGANAMLCLLAARAGSTNCEDGLSSIRSVIDKSDVDGADVILVDGQGADPASTTPRQMTGWMMWARQQPWGDDLIAGQPVLGESGTLASVGADSPAVGKVAAKTGTSAALDPVTGRLLYNVQSLAGYLFRDDGTPLVFALSMSGGTFEDFSAGLTQAGDDVGMVAAAFAEKFAS